MKTPMTFEQWYGHRSLLQAARTPMDLAEESWNAALANSPQPQWHRWSESKPTVENEWGSKNVLIEMASDNRDEQFFVRDIPDALIIPWQQTARVAWLYILPSGFAPKQKDEAEVAWQKWSDTYYLTMPLTPVILKDKWIEAFNLGRAQGKLKVES